MTSAQRERLIAACGRHMLACYAAGDREMAKCWLAAQNAAIRERDQGCFFMLEGDKARAAARGGEA
ncbi:hypothetical protein [Xenophilus sp. Marseille-Q4582]|uniref:hypothetical protein n=1 Tax=Xenophilus sp. Marseille-Q4582 TaxID=2866600 RepID=UPI001CE40231|nr:hypothetical protein [Xenophilus sp. Marseille-Q4582]